MGRYLIEAIPSATTRSSRAILVFATPCPAVNLLVDISYGVLDPRVRPE